MRDLRLVGVHEDGEHVVLTDADGERFQVAIDDELRRSVRVRQVSTTSTEASDEDAVQMRPRDIQALLRSGLTMDEVAERSGWTVEKIRRYEPPIRAERDYVAGLARNIAIYHPGPRQAEPATFAGRVQQRLDGRGVPAEEIVWDSWRGNDGVWTVQCAFPAGGRLRQANWRFEVSSRTLAPQDDEARWLGEDEQTPGPLSAAPSGRDVTVYDVEAEGGLAGRGGTSVRRVRGGTASATAIPAAVAPATPADKGATPVDLVSAMRERSKGRRKRGRTKPDTTFPADAVPAVHVDTTGVEPPLGSHPRPDEIDPPAPATAKRSEASDGDAAPRKQRPTVEDLGHDPVTGTVSMFADAELTDSESTRAPLDSQPATAADDAADETVDVAQVAADDETADGAQAGQRTSANDARETAEQQERVTPLAAAEAATPDDSVVPPERPSAARKGRPAVPSWDDIMFGRRPGND
ncbi:septation protein SepH [Rudaeicoccus suwonensis]|uniref:DUF3071 family protein n=1 Tax=Rudaeicoccus suwonensis TaxID=657409 RepID=A0A561EBJ9_9MICO|nr:septation protein SepH [Rudaeicoccus suwonensis]TWE12972.1 DUF3071 family protein [Rudaeicoccus suwonensis]